MKKVFFIFLFCLLTSQIYSYDQVAYQALLKGEKNLVGKDLSKVDFSGRNFKGLSLKDLNLEKANLSRSKIVDVDLSGSILNQANLDNATLKNVKVSRVSLLGASFKESILDNVDFSNATLGGSIKETVKTNFGTALKIFKTNFIKATLKDVKFKSVIFNVGDRTEDRYKQGGTSFYECHMDGVIFDESIVKKIRIDKCNIKDSSFLDLKLEGAYKSPISFYLESSKLDGCSFTDSTFKNKYAVYSMSTTILLRTKGLSQPYERMLREKGAHIPTYSVLCNADMHEDADKVHRPDKREQISKMIEVTKNKSNNVDAIVWPGDFCHRGEKADWDLFIKNYFNKLKKDVKAQFFCVGNHDRWQREGTTKEWLNMAFRSAIGKPSYAIEKINEHYGKISGDSKWKKSYYKYHMNYTDFVSLGECPTMPDKEPVSWFVKKIAKNKYPKILFYHYTPISNWSVGWWTTGKSPRPEDKKRGIKAVNYFYEKIKPYKNEIILQITGHEHKNIYENWRDIPTICVGGDRFALVHIDPQYPKKINNKWEYLPEVVAIEFIHPTKKTETYYPCLDKFDQDYEKNAFIVKAFNKILGRSPGSSALQFYITKWKNNTSWGRWELEQEIKNSDEYIKFEINEFYKKYLARKADASGLNNYLKVWKKEGEGKVENSIKNSKEARPKLLKKWYKEYLGREPDEEGQTFWLGKWDELKTEKVEDAIKNSKEARPKLLKKWYKEYLGKEPDEGGKTFWLGKWDELKAKKVEDAIKNSPDSITYRKKLFGK